MKNIMERYSIIIEGYGTAPEIIKDLQTLISDLQAGRAVDTTTDYDRYSLSIEIVEMA